MKKGLTQVSLPAFTPVKTLSDWQRELEGLAKKHGNDAVLSAFVDAKADEVRFKVIKPT